MKLIYRPSIAMTIIAASAIFICIKLGFWQYNKAQAKQKQQQILSLSQLAAPVDLPENASLEKAAIENWRFKRVKFSGTYDTKYQVFLDNQVEDAMVGYHVFTPMRVVGNTSYVLIDRGWVKGAGIRQIPTVLTPQGEQLMQGDIGLPPSRFYTLEAPVMANGQWQSVWQNLDMQRYAKSVPFKILPFVVRLDAQSDAGGFVRNWPIPGDRVAKHLGYAYQWFGFAFTIFAIYLVLNVKREPKKYVINN